MPRAPRVTADEVLRALNKDGLRFQRQVGSHRMLSHATKTGIPNVPYHAGQIIPLKTLKSILVQAGLTMDEFRNLL